MSAKVKFDIKEYFWTFMAFRNFHEPSWTFIKSN